MKRRWLKSLWYSFGWSHYAGAIVLGLILWSLWSGAHGMVTHASAVARTAVLP